MQILIALIIFLEIISYIVIIDVILSWLMIFGLKLRPKFIADIIDPLYKGVKKIVPTNIGPLDFTPIVIIIGIMFIRGAIYLAFPELQLEINNLLR